MYKQAAEATKSTDNKKIAEWLRAGNPMKTVLGEIKLDAKGDIVNPIYVWYTFKDGKYFEDTSINKCLCLTHECPPLKRRAFYRPTANKIQPRSGRTIRHEEIRIDRHCPRLCRHAQRRNSALADLTVATVGPISGQLAALGEQYSQGAKKAVADINAAGGINGEKLVLEIGDDACDPKQAVSVANQMASKGVKFVAGHLCSGSSIPASKVYEEEGIMMITPGLDQPEVHR